MEALGWWGVPLAVLGGAIRGSTPFLFVSLGECLTEKSGRINLGLEGTLVMGAMSGYGVSYLTGSPWLGVLVAGTCGMVLGAVHASICARPRVNDIAVGIALMLFGLGLAFYLGKPFIQPNAPRLPAIPFGWWSESPQVRAALEVNVLFLIGAVLAPGLLWALYNTRWGLAIRAVGDNADAARTMGYAVDRVRLLGTVAGGFLAGIGGSFLSLYYPGSWNEAISSGQASHLATGASHTQQLQLVHVARDSFINALAGTMRLSLAVVVAGGVLAAVLIQGRGLPARRAEEVAPEAVAEPVGAH